MVKGNSLVDAPWNLPHVFQYIVQRSALQNTRTYVTY